MNIEEQAIALRVKGYSYNEINKKLGIPKATLSSWLKNVALSKKASKRLVQRVRMGVLNGLVKRNEAQTDLAKKRANRTREKSASEVGKISDRDLHVLGTILYWGEGYKRLKIVNGKERTSHPIFLTNSDPAIINGFILFLLKTMKIPRENIKMSLRLFPHMNAEKEIEYWSKITGIPTSQFNKPSFVISKSSQSKKPFNRLPHGIAQVRVLSTNEFYRLMGWIDGMKNSLDNLFKKR